MSYHIRISSKNNGKVPGIIYNFFFFINCLACVHCVSSLNSDKNKWAFLNTIWVELGLIFKSFIKPISFHKCDNLKPERLVPLSVRWNACVSLISKCRCKQSIDGHFRLTKRDEYLRCSQVYTKLPPTTM